MTDFATLVLGADTRGLATGERALAGLTAAGSKAEASLTRSMDRAAAGFDRTADASKRLSQQANIATGHLGSLTSQWNDIAVMMAAGQNPMQLALQQGTQVTQVLSQMGGGVGALRAVGMSFVSMLNPVSLATLAIIGFGAAAVQWFTGAGQGAKTLEDRIKDLNSGLRDYLAAQELANAATGEAAAQYGLAAGAASKYFDSIAGLSRVSLDQQIKAEATALLDMVGSYDAVANEIGNVQRAAEFFGQSNALFGESARNLRSEIVPLIEDLQAYRDASDVSERIGSLEQVQLRLETLVMLDGKISAAEQDILDAVQAQMGVLLPLRKEEIDLAQRKIGLSYEALAASKAESAAAMGAADGMLQIYRRQGELSAIALEHGRESAQYYETQKRHAIEDLNVKLATLPVAESIKDEIRQQALHSMDLSNMLGAASDAVDALTGRVQFLAGVFGPAIGAANQLAQALANAASQLGGVTSGIANFTAAGQGVSAVTGFFGAMANPVETAKKALAGAGKALQTYHAGAVNAAQAGAKLDLTLGKIGGGGGKKRGGSAGGAADALDEAAKAAAALREEMERPFITAIDGVADAWGDFLSRGGQDFKGFASDIKDTFQRLISGMIADAARNRIMVWLGLGQGGAVPGSDGVPSAGGLASLGGIFGKDGWLGSRLSSGKGFLGSIGSLLGFGGTAGAAGAGGGLLSGLTGFLGTAGALLGGIGALIGIGKALFGRSLKDVGVQGSFTGDNFSGETYKFYKGGLLRSDKTSTEALDAATSAVIGSAYADLRGNIRDMAGVLGLGSDAIKDFAHDFKISTKDMTQEQIVQALQEEMGKAGAGMAEIVLGTDRFTRAGESALDTMTRLSSSLMGVRDVADLLGHRFAWAGLRGADLASGVVDAFGGLDQMGSAVQAYWQTFYGENARLRTVTRQTRETLADLGAAMPRTRDEYRRMIEAINLSDRSSHELYATLIGLSGVMDQILPAASGLTRQLERMQDRLSLQLGRVAEGLTEAIRINRAAADDWFRAGDTIRDYLDKLRGSASALVSRQAALAYNRVMYLGALRDARGGNVEAAQGLSGRAQDYLASVMGSASTAFEAARAQARVMAQIGGVAATSDRYGNALDRAATLQERQLTAIERLQELIASGGTVTAERLAAVRERIAAVDGSISVVSRRNADLTIAGFNDALTSNPVQIEGGMALREAMGGLRGSLRELRQAVMAETERQERESRIAALNRFVSGLTLNGQGKAFVGDADLSRMAEIVGLNTSGLSTAQIRNRLAGYSSTDKLTGTVYDPTGSREAAYLERQSAGSDQPDTITDPLMGFRLGYGWRGSVGGAWRQIIMGPLGGMRAFDVPDDQKPADWLAQMVKDKKLPAFEAGGYHSGGLRMVGEGGPELEVTGPARYYNARQTQQMMGGGSPEMLAELRAMRAEMAALRSEHRQLALKTEQNTFETARYARSAERRAQAAES